jgi:hypothetical protein
MTGRALATAAIVLLLVAGRAAACPFCTALKPTLVQQREAADVTAVGELLSLENKQATFKLHRVLAGASKLANTGQLVAPLDQPLAKGALAVLFGSRAVESAENEAAFEWTIVPVDEGALGYFLKAPLRRMPAAQRLRYFAAYLEHANPLVAEDAYMEFGHAPFESVAEAIDALSMERLRDHLTDERVPQARKGFYGMALGLAQEPADRQANLALLRREILAPADEFRAGFDGLIGGYLLLAGRAGLELIEERYLDNPQAAAADVRHALLAVRFYREYGRQIPRERLATAIVHVLARPEVAAAAIVDLARFEHWDAVERISGLYRRKGYEDQAIGRAVVGYLTHCPRPEAVSALAQLRRTDPDGVAAAELALEALGGKQ